MKCLGIESTAHTFSCAVLERKGKRGKILSDVRKIYGPPEGEGIHPREASRHHVENSTIALVEALQKANVSVTDLDIISYAAGPGLGPCLRVGAVVSRALASYYEIPIFPVNHALGHIELGKMLTGAKNPLVLLVSGGHTMLLAFLNKNWRVFGETLDITLGQLLDQFGRTIGFASPCGKKIEELAEKNHNYVPLPYSVKGNDVSFSGLLSALQKNIHRQHLNTWYKSKTWSERYPLFGLPGVQSKIRDSQNIRQYLKRVYWMFDYPASTMLLSVHQQFH